MKKSSRQTPSKIKNFFSVIVLLVIGLWAVKDPLIKMAAEKIGTQILGARVSIQKLSLDLLKQKIRINNLVIGNPPGFPQEHLLLMPEITVQCDTAEALKGVFHFPLIVVNLKEMVLIKNKDGKLNVDELKVVAENLHKPKPEDAKGDKKSAPENVSAPAPTKPAPSLGDIKISIDLLKLNVERVIYKDFTKGEPPVIQVYDVALKNKTIKNINNIYSMVSRILLEALKPTAIRKAGMFATTSLLGAGFLPGAALGVIVAKDDASAQFDLPYKKVFDEVFKLINELGVLKKTDNAKGVIFAKIYDCDVSFEIKEIDKRSVTVKVKARKYMLAKPNIASGILYQLTEKLK